MKEMEKKKQQKIKYSTIYKNHCCEKGKIYYCLVPHGLILYQHLRKQKVSRFPLDLLVAFE